MVGVQTVKRQADTLVSVLIVFNIKSPHEYVHGIMSFALSRARYAEINEWRTRNGHEKIPGDGMFTSLNMLAATGDVWCFGLLRCAGSKINELTRICESIRSNVLRMPQPFFLVPHEANFFDENQPAETGLNVAGL